MVVQRFRPKTLTEILRKAIQDSGPNFKKLERESGVLRQSLMKFASGEQSLRLDMADKLAAYFDFELAPAKRKRK